MLTLHGLHFPPHPKSGRISTLNIPLNDANCVYRKVDSMTSYTCRFLAKWKNSRYQAILLGSSPAFDLSVGKIKLNISLGWVAAAIHQLCISSSWYVINPSTKELSNWLSDGLRRQIGSWGTSHGIRTNLVVTSIKIKI